MHTNDVRQYPQQYRMVWIACVFLLILMIAEWTTILYQPIQKAQQNLLGGAEKRYIDTTGTVTESKKGQSYFFMQTETGENLYVKLPYVDYVTESQKSIAWYPVGTIVKIQGQISFPDCARNPGGFDESAWLYSKKTGVVLDAQSIQVIAEPQGIWRMVFTLHNEMEHILYDALSVEQADLAMALLTGAKHRLSDEFYMMTQHMGIAHIFAVSGLHVGIVGSIVLCFFYYMKWMRSWVSFTILAIGLGIYCMLAGLPASALRAAGMILISAVAIRLYRPPTALNFLAFTAVVILLNNPFLLWNAGFQLSFGVTLALLLLASPIQQKLQFIHNEKLRCSIAVVLAAWLGSVPLTAWHFYTFSPLSPLYNFFLVPFVSITVPAILAGFFLSVLIPIWTNIFFFPVKFALWLLETATVYLYGLIDHVQWNIGQPDTIIVLLYVFFLVLFWHWLKGKPLISENKYNNTVLILLTVFILVFSIPLPPKHNELLYLDTGQGSCAMLRTKAGEVVLFDTGSQAQELASVLAWYGVNQIDAVILSHGDVDHINGLARVLNTVSVAAIYIEQSQIKRGNLTDLLTMAIHQGTECIAVDMDIALHFKAHHVVIKPFWDDTETTNRKELAAMLYYSDGAAAFPGDLSLSAVQRFAACEEFITIWTVPHHGSRNSGSAYLYQQLKRKGVQYVVISAGQDNGYGHPHKEVLQWINDAQIEQYCTAEQGAVLFLLP